MSKYLIDGCEVSTSDPNFDNLLLEAYKSKDRPKCLCQFDGVQMYLAKMNDSVFIKRMPGTGNQHSFSCVSFEPPPELSGLAQVNGSAIKEDQESETTKIKIGFSLAKTEGRKAPEMGEGEKKPGEVSSDPTKLTMRALLHYLYEEAGWNRFSPDYPVKRNWFQLRKAILQASEAKSINGNPISELLFVPETFFLDQKEEIRKRRKKTVAPAVYRGTGKRNMMLVFGEIKSIEPDSFGYKIILKHLADFKFRISDDLFKKISKKYAPELGLWEELAELGHLLVMGTFFIDLKGYATMESCTFQIADQNWIIFESGSEKYLLNSLNDESRSYIKGLRYNLGNDTPFASVVLTDLEKPLAMYVTPDNCSDLYLSRQLKLVKESDYDSWLWNSEEELPSIP